MSTKLNTELEGLQRFVAERLNGHSLSLEESVAAYREYQVQLARFKSDVQPAVDELNAGNGTPLDMQAILATAKRQLA